MAPSLSKRQCSYSDYANGNCDTDPNDGWWWSSSGLGVRYAVVVIILAAIFLFLIIAYLHARRRMRKGLAPLAYHRWLVARRARPTYANSQYFPDRYNLGPTYGMNHQEPMPPPPAYNSWDVPPTYQPPPGATKTMPNQNTELAHGGVGESSNAGMQYPPPAHPPPGHS